jgi:hypothetical protein
MVVQSLTATEKMERNKEGIWGPRWRKMKGMEAKSF